MTCVRVGTSGLTISHRALGCMSYGEPARAAHPWTRPDDQDRPQIRAALDAGIPTVDTADIYVHGPSRLPLAEAPSSEGETA